MSEEPPAYLGCFPGTSTNSGAQKSLPAYLPQTPEKSHPPHKAWGTAVVKGAAIPGASAGGIRRPSLGLEPQGPVPLTQLAFTTRPLMRKASLAGLSQQPAPALSSQGSAHYQSSNPSRSHGNHRSFLSKAEEEEGRGGATVERTGVLCNLEA